MTVCPLPAADRPDGAPCVQVAAVAPSATADARGDQRRRPHPGKAWFDALAGLVLAVVVLPLVLMTGLLILAVDGRPVLFSQTRVGRDGRAFRIWKLRTMRRTPGALEVDAGLQRLQPAKGRGDPRVTPLGRWLRRFSIDELPQLWNVLRGEMSLVGPRPLLPDEVTQVADPDRCRFHVRPGMTGLWQVSGRADLPLAEGARLDRYYVENWSAALDVAVLCRTAGAVLGGRGAY